MLQRQHEVVRGVQVKCNNAEPGTSNPKGKGIDPHEWGNLELDEEELDIMCKRLLSIPTNLVRRIPGTRKYKHLRKF